MDSMLATMEGGLRKKPLADWTDEEQALVRKVNQQCFDKLEEHLRAAEAMNKHAFVKEHCMFLSTVNAMSELEQGVKSPTGPSWKVELPSKYLSENNPQPSPAPENILLPDLFLKTIHPTFLIRHPALAFPSEYRTIVEKGDGTDHQLVMRYESGDHLKPFTLKWQRELHDWFLDYYASRGQDPAFEVDWPIVIDADDVQSNSPVLSRYANILGLDPEVLVYEWRAETTEALSKRPAMINRMLRTLDTSTGVLPGLTSAEIDISAEAKKWHVEFGADGAQRLEYWVRKAMPDYEALRARKLRPTA